MSIKSSVGLIYKRKFWTEVILSHISRHWTDVYFNVSCFINDYSYDAVFSWEKFCEILRLRVRKIGRLCFGAQYFRNRLNFRQKFQFW